MKFRKILLIIAIALVAYVLAFGVKWFWNYCSAVWFKPEFVQTESVEESEMKLFFESSIEPIIMKLDLGLYPIEEVQKKYSSILHDLAKKYDGRKIARRVSPVYYKDRSDIYSFSLVNNGGDPIWGFVAPSLMDKMAQIDGTNVTDISETFELFVVVQVLHELSKLVYLADVQDRTPDSEYLIESFIWADICDEVLGPIIEVHGVVLDDQTFNWHFGWVYSGKKTNEDWRSFVREQFVPAQK